MSVKIRKGQPNLKLSREQFESKFKQTFNEAFNDLEEERKLLIEKAWQIYQHNSPSEEKTELGDGFSDPNYKFSKQWVTTSLQLKKLAEEQKSSPSQILVICASPRNQNTCPNEVSKSFRLSQIAIEEIKNLGIKTQLLDLSEMTGEYGKTIYPCKGCVSTAMPLCHWPCSCYPNHVLGQTQDWMSDIYEHWIKAHGVMIITPVHWYSPPSVLKLMMDRLVCADGGNPDPSTTKGKTPELAKEIELKGWDFPKHLAGRSFSVVAHGDAGGAEAVQSALTTWLEDMHMVSAGHDAQLARYIGYLDSYAKSHQALDQDEALKKEVEIAAKALVQSIESNRRHPPRLPDDGPRAK